MGNVIDFRPESNATSVQLSAYPQEDGSQLYCVEVLFADGTWDRTAHTKDGAEGWKLAAQEAFDWKVPLLPTSSFPGRAA